MESQKAYRGTLYLIPTPLGDQDRNVSIPDYNLEIIMSLDIFIVEELRTARRFLRKFGYKKDFDTVTFYVLNEHTPFEEMLSFRDPLKEGKSIGLLSEAGCPNIADPGEQLIYQSHVMGARVIPLTGPSSIIMSLMASGLTGQQFTFHGYLPVKPDERSQKIKEIDRLISKGHNHTHIFIEAPYRNRQLLEALLQHLSEDTLLCVAANITMHDESINTMRVGEWKKRKSEPGKVPTVFLVS